MCLVRCSAMSARHAAWDMRHAACTIKHASYGVRHMAHSVVACRMRHGRHGVQHMACGIRGMACSKRHAAHETLHRARCTAHKYTAHGPYGAGVCKDASPTGVVLEHSDKVLASVSCPQLAALRYCSHSVHGATIKRICPKSCNACVTLETVEQVMTCIVRTI